jgi:hypothetical protein
MLPFLKNRLRSYIHKDDVVNADYKSFVLPDDLDLDDIEFFKVRGNVRLCDQNVLTPKEETKMLDEVLSFDFGK